MNPIITSLQKPSLYDRILFIGMSLLFKSISKDIPIAVSAADIANNNTVTPNNIPVNHGCYSVTR